MNKDLVRFESYLTKSDTCWLWKGGKDIKGYGIFFYNGKASFAHRISLLLYNKIKNFTPGLQVLHSCRNKDCVNPDHLKEGTKEENAQDKVRDGTDLRGERCHFSKLNWTKVDEIRKKANQSTRANLAQEFGVSQSTIGLIINNKSWIKI